MPNENPIINLKFVGIDSFNRPIFKDIATRNHYGHLDTLFSYGTSQGEVLDRLGDEGLQKLRYFGKSFGCEPMGSTVNAIFKVGEESA